MDQSISNELVQKSMEICSAAEEIKKPFPEHQHALFILSLGMSDYGCKFMIRRGVAQSYIHDMMIPTSLLGGWASDELTGLCLFWPTDIILGPFCKESKCRPEGNRPFLVGNGRQITTSSL